MRRVFVRVILLLLALFVLLPGRGSAEDLNNFTVTDYRIEYHLSRDDEQRSVLKTTETITADFRIANQNHGIERAIPKGYDGHPTSLKIISVKDETGADRQYHTYTSDGNLVVRIGDPDKYVLGKQTYVITYTQRDVTKYFADVVSDEFYWDTNGTGWRVPIANLSVALTIDGALVGNLTGNTSCYQGAEGSTQTCTITRSDNQFTAHAANLSPYQNLTVAIGFQPGTFAAYDMPLWQKILAGWLALQILLTIIGIGIIIWLAIRYRNWQNRRKERATIVPQYLPPTDTSVTTSAMVLGSGKGMVAQIIDLAVRRYLRLYQTHKKTTFKPADYTIEVIKDVSLLSAEEQEALAAIYGRVPQVGKSLQLSTLRQNAAVYSRLTKNAKKLKKLIRGEYGLRRQDPKKSAWFGRAGKILLVLGVLFLSPVLLIAAAVAFAMSKALWPLTGKGLELLRHLDGLKHYISIAEAERLRVLQGPESAQKIAIKDGKPDAAELIKLYERLLPYAILFGQEKEWNKRLAQYYDAINQSPNWVVGNNGALLSSAAFLSAVNDFSAAHYGTFSSSSTTGGSAGGGSSGSGGGGGGGGGW